MRVVAVALIEELAKVAIVAFVAAGLGVLDTAPAWCPVTSSCVTSLRSAAVLMEPAAKAIAAFHLAVRGWGQIGRSAGRPLPKALVRPGLVIVLEELRQHPLQVPADEDQQVIEALAPGGTREMFEVVEHEWQAAAAEVPVEHFPQGLVARFTEAQYVRDDVY
jgi:hypothetical protein